MKRLLDIIKEVNNPDTVTIPITYKRERNGETFVRKLNVGITWHEKYAKPFIYCLKKNTILWGNNGDCHPDMLMDLNLDDYIKYGLNNVKSLDDLYNRTKRNTENYQKNKHDFKVGRVYDFTASDINANGDMKEIYLVWWNELDEVEFNTYSRNVLKEYVNDHQDNTFKIMAKRTDNFKNDKTIDKYVVIDNNGKPIEFDISGKTKHKVDARSEENKHEIEIARAIHNGTAEEKKKFFRPWKDAINKAKEKELQKLGIRDGTYAKRNDKFAKHVVRDEKTGKYKVVYGAKIGDSLETYVDNFVFETLTRSYDLKKFIEQVKEKFDVDCSSYMPWESGRCMIGFKKFNKDDETLQHLMNLFNVFISDISEEDITLVYFEQTYGKEVTNEVYKYNKVYHLTKSKFVNKILKNGLQPRKNIGGHKKKAYHPDRVYLLSEEIDKRMIQKYASQLITTDLIVVDLKKLKAEYNTTLKFYKDPQSEETYSIYTDSVIRPEVLAKTTIKDEFK